MSRYFTATIDAEGEHVSTVDRPYLDGRIVNVNIGPLSIMCGGKTEEETEATLLKLHDALQTLLAASQARRRAALDIDDTRRAATDAAVYVAGGATPSEAVEWATKPHPYRDRPDVEHVTRTPAAPTGSVGAALTRYGIPPVDAVDRVEGEQRDRDIEAFGASTGDGL